MSEADDLFQKHQQAAADAAFAQARAPKQPVAFPKTNGEQLLDWLRSKKVTAEEAPNMVRSALQGVTSNLAPRILSAEEGLAASGIGPTSDPSKFKAAYDAALPGYQKQYTQAAADHPVANIAGAVLQPNPASKLGALARVGYAGANGYVANRAAAPLDQAPEAQDSEAKSGALKSMAIQGGLEVASPALARLARSLRSSAGTQAANAAGLRSGITNQAKRAGIPMLDAAGEAEIPKLGNQMLDEGLIPFGGSKIDVLKRSNKLMEQSGNAQDAILTRAEMSGTPFNFDKAANESESRLAEHIDPTKGGDLQTARAAGPSNDLLKDIRATGTGIPSGSGGFLAANKLKTGAYNSTNWGLEAPVAPTLKRATVGGLRASIEAQVSGALGSNEGDALRKVNEKYGLGAKTADFAEEAAGREAAHQKFGWGSLMLGATGAGAGASLGPAGAVAGAALPGFAYLGKTRGNAMAAHGFRLGSEVANVAQAVNQSPAAASGLAQFLPKVGTPEAQQEAARQMTEATGESPKDEKDLAKKHFDRAF